MTKTIIKSHIWEREANEHYVEPSWCSARLFEEENFEGLIWDPCCGFGTIPKVAIDYGFEVFATDLIDRGYDEIHHVASFLDFNIVEDNVVCNPPFKIIKDFALHAMKSTTHKVAMICPAPRLNAAHAWL